MKKTERECVCCGLPCMRNGCPYYSVTRHYCDRCGEETTLYYYEDEELCMDCIIEDLKETLEEVE